MVNNSFNPINATTLSSLIDMLEVLISNSEKYQIEDRGLKRKIDGLYVDILCSARKLDSSLDYPDTIFGNKDLVVKKKHQDIKIYDDNYRKSIINFIETISKLPIKSKNLSLIDIEINSKTGVVKRLDNQNEVQFTKPRTSKRFGFIVKIIKHSFRGKELVPEKIKGKTLAERLSYLSKEIKVINKRLILELKLKGNFIENDSKKGTGYFVNKDIYRVRLL